MKIAETVVRWRKFEVGERVRHIKNNCICGEVLNVRDPTSSSCAVIDIVSNEGGQSIGWMSEQFEPIPEIPIAPEERAAAWWHPDFGSLHHYLFDGCHKYKVVEYNSPELHPHGNEFANTPDEALDAFIRAHRSGS